MEAFCHTIESRRIDVGARTGTMRLQSGFWLFSVLGPPTAACYAVISPGNDQPVSEENGIMITWAGATCEYIPMSETTKQWECGGDAKLYARRVRIVSPFWDPAQGRLNLCEVPTIER